MMKYPIPKILLFCLLLFTHCAYYNTFYNAKKFFKEAEKERAKRKTDSPTAAEKQKYTKAIEKASKLLEFYPNSKYVDDALILLGECFYYQQEYHKAKRKFEELLAYFPDSDFASEARLWLGKTNLKLKDYPTAEKQFREFLGEKTQRKLKDEAQFLLAELFYQQENFTAAAKEYKIAARKAKDKSLRARAYFQRGECYLKMKDYSQAIENFNQARKFSPDDKSEFEALFKVGLCQKFLAQYDQAIKVFTRLLSKESNKDDWPRCKLEIADCLFRKGKTDDAITWYTSIIEEHPKSDASARAHFHLGDIYERTFADYTKAKEYYDKVKVEYARSECVSDAVSKSKNIQELLKITKAIKDQELKLATADSQSVVADTTNNEAQQPNLDSVPEDSMSKDVQAQAGLTRETTGTKVNKKASVVNNPLNELARDRLLLAELFLFQFNQPDSALKQYRAILETDSTSPYIPKVIYSMGYIYEHLKDNKKVADSLYLVVAEKYPNSPQANKAREKLQLPELEPKKNDAYIQFQRAEKDFWDRGDIKAALSQYERIVNEFPRSQWAPKAMYAIGWIYEMKLKSNKEAFQAYQRLIEEYPDSEYAKRVQKKVAAVQRKTEEEKKKATETEAELLGGDNKKEEGEIKEASQDTTIKKDTMLEKLTKKEDRTLPTVQSKKEKKRAKADVRP